MIKNQKITPSHGKSFLLDVHAINDGTQRPVIIFSHGFKGFKDWGHWGLIGEYFAKEGFIFIKYNFSHNGTTLENPHDFDDLEAFGENNFSKELEDLGAVIDWVSSENSPLKSIFNGNITLIGHSRGGATSILKAIHDTRVHQLITWASVNAVDYAWRKERFVEKWSADGVIYARNGRTKQDMPLNFQLYEDFISNKDRFDIQKLSRDFNKPYLILHGDKDPAVSIESAKYLHQIFKNSKMEIIFDANHVFNGFHPYNLETLPKETVTLLDKSIEFLRKQ